MRHKAVTFVVVLVASLVLAGCALLPAGRQRTTARNEPTPTPIPTPIVPTKPVYKVERGEVVKQRQFSGRISAVSSKDLFFRTSGRVRSISVKSKDMVKAGQILADLEMDDLERELNSTQLEYDRAQVRLKAAQDSLADDVKRAQANLDIAKLNLATVMAQDPAPRKEQAQAELQKASLALKQAQEAYNQIAWRNDKGTTAEAAALEQATLAYTQAKATYDLAMQAIATHPNDAAIQAKQVELAQIAVDQLKRGVDPLLVNDVERAKLDVEKLKATIANGQIIAPFDGQVMSITLTEGRAAEAFKPVVTVVDPNSLEVSAEPLSAQMSELAEGMPAKIELSSGPGQVIEGTVRRLPYPYGSGAKASDAEEDKSIRISFNSTVDKSTFEMGDIARVTIVLERKADVLWLPTQAVRTFEGRKFAVIQDGEGQRRVDIKIGIESDDRVEIEEGLTEGQTVIGQ